MSHLRNRLFSTMMAAGFLFPLLAPAQQQTVATAKIPFSFSLGDRVLPPGIYQFRQSAGNILEISGETQSAFVMVQPEEDRSLRDKGALVFLQDGGLQLKEIRAPFSGVHLYCMPLRTRMHQQLAIGKPAAPQTVTIAIAEPRR